MYKSRKFPGSLESFQTVWKVFRQSGKFPDSLESFQRVWKVSGQCEKFSAMYAMAYIACMRIFAAKTIYVLRPESFCASNSADRKVLTFVSLRK